MPSSGTQKRDVSAKARCIVPSLRHVSPDEGKLAALKPQHSTAQQALHGDLEIATLVGLASTSFCFFLGGSVSSGGRTLAFLPWTLCPAATPWLVCWCDSWYFASCWWCVLLVVRLWEGQQRRARSPHPGCGVMRLACGGCM